MLTRETDTKINEIRKNIAISMTETSEPFENTIAERVRGILKQEFMIRDWFRIHLMVLKELMKSNTPILAKDCIGVIKCQLLRKSSLEFKYKLL
jgi:hypothetical protein